MVIQENMTIQRKLEILSDAAKYDVACTSSGVDRKGNGVGIGNSAAAGICHSFSADGRCISLLKILFTNECIFDCKYCINRSSNDVVRASFTPEEVCGLTMEFYRRNYIEGLFLSSGIVISPNHTMELMLQALRMLRDVHHFNGYIHCKAIPGADPELVELLGWYADRMSVNLELPTAESLKELAPHKNRRNILKPIRQIQLRRESAPELFGILDSSFSDNRSMTGFTAGHAIPAGPYPFMGNQTTIGRAVAFSGNQAAIGRTADYAGAAGQSVFFNNGSIIGPQDDDIREIATMNTAAAPYKKPLVRRSFVPAGQSTQMIIGATQESDYQIMSVAEALYDNFNLKRVFYSAFINVNEDSRLPATTDGPPLLREHRLYQADWLLRFYGFTSGELLNEKHQNFNLLLDPKCDWALRHLECFPVEVNKADMGTLLRVPGIGVNSARRIVMARKSAVLSFSDLKRMGIVLKRAIYFITCNGSMMYPVKIEENFITRQLMALKDQLPFGMDKDITYRQLSLFDDVRFRPEQRITSGLANV